MKTISRIIKNELKMLFSSPIAWLILVIFAYQTGMVFCDVFERQLKYLVTGYPLLKLTDQLFNVRSVFYQIQSNLYLYIPLLTMGIMSREYNSGSIKLLYSSPITNAQIIWGKFMALMVYCAALLCVVILLVIFADFTVKDLDLGAIASGLLGLYLLACAYCAIGLYMSTLTSYQVVAAVGTLAVLAVLNFIGGVGQEIEWIRDVTYWLSISGRASEMITGLICSEDVVYFVAVIALFLTLSIMKLKYERGKESYVKMILHYTGVVMVVAAIAFISSRPGWMSYYDATQTNHKTLSLGSKAVMDSIGLQKMTITTYVNLLESNYHFADKKKQLEDMKRFEQYSRFNPNIDMKYVYYWADTDNSEWDTHYPDLTPAQRASHLANAWRLKFDDFLTPEQLAKQIDLAPEEFRMVRVIEDEKGQKSFLRMYDDMSRFPSEKEISAAFRRLTTKPTLYKFVTGHGERGLFDSSDNGYYSFGKQNGFRYSLINQGFDTDTLSLETADETANGADVIVIADPQRPYTASELGELEHYIATGKNFFITCSPQNREFINPILNLFGGEMTEGTIVRKHQDFASNLTLASFTPQGRTFSPVLAYLDRQGYKITAPNAMGIRQIAKKGFHFVPIVATDSIAGYWAELQTKDFVNEVSEFNPEKGETEANGMPIITLLARDLDNKKQQKVVVMGSADCISNNEFTKGRNGVSSANYELILQTGLWFSDGKFPVNTDRPDRPDNRINHVNYSQMAWIKAFFMILVPLILAIIGTRIYIRRSRV